MILYWRASIVRDTILSGFELELYSSDERPVAYRFLRNVLSMQIMTLIDMQKTDCATVYVYVAQFIQGHLVHINAVCI